MLTAECTWDDLEEIMNNKIAVVTGGANGIGKGIVQELQKDCKAIVIADIDAEAGKLTEKQLTNDECEVKFFRIDLSKDQEIEDLFKFVIDTYGQIDILINNAGIQIRNWAIDFDMAQFDRLMGINLRAYYLCAKTAARYMKERRYGSIVCISSVNSVQYHSKRSPYNISKAAINGMVGTLGVEWGRYNIRINAVAPGYVETDIMLSGIRSGIINEKQIKSVIPMKRYVSVSEIGKAVRFLASDDASAVTGQVLCVDCGWSKNALPEEEDME